MNQNDIEAMIQRYTEAEMAVLDGKSVTFNGQQMTMENLSEIRQGRQEWERRLAALITRRRGHPGYSGTVVNRPTFFAFAKGAGVMGEAGPEAILPLRRGADGKLGVVADIGGSGMAMFAPQYNIEINNDGTNGQIGPAALKVVYDLGKKAAADFMQQQSRDGGLFSGGGR